MSNPSNENGQHIVSRRSVLKGGAAGVAAAAVGLAAPKIAEAHKKRKRLRIDVKNAVFTAGSGSVNNFIVVGDIVKVNEKNAKGKFFCKGVFFSGEAGPLPDAVTFINQRFRIDGEGSILGAGAEGDGRGEDLGILGGTGKWGERGEPMPKLPEACRTLRSSSIFIARGNTERRSCSSALSEGFLGPSEEALAFLSEREGC